MFQYLRTNARLRAEKTEYERLLREADAALRDWKRRWGREVTRVAELEIDLRACEAARQQLELDLTGARALADAHVVTIRDLEADLAPFKRPQARDTKGHFLADAAP